jgi:hypothetical protein
VVKSKVTAVVAGAAFSSEETRCWLWAESQAVSEIGSVGPPS